jgi:hypothetical protein
MGWDGIRAPWRIARYIILYGGSNMEASVASEALAHGLRNNFRHTGSRAMDAAMYLPLSTILEHSSARNLANIVLNPGTNNHRYYENTLILLGLIDTLYPRRVNINSCNICVR